MDSYSSPRRPGLAGAVCLALSISLLLGGCSGQPEFQEADTKPSRSQTEEPNNIQVLPTPSQKFDTPWPTDVTGVELTDTALFATYSYFNAVRQKNCDAEYVVHLGNPILEVHKPNIELFVKQTVEIFCENFKNPVVVIGGNNDFVLSTVSENGYPADEYGGVCGYEVPNDANGGCAFYDIAWIGSNWGSAENPMRIRYAIVAHEIFHIVQYNLDPEPGAQIPGPGHPLFRPVWFIEGAGDYFGRAVASYLDLYPYSREIPRTKDGLFLEATYLADLDLLEEWQDKGSRGENYFSGQRAMEYIIASKGVEAIMDLTKQLGSGEKFEKAFEQTIGIPLPDFYQKFRELFANLYGTNLVDTNY